MLNFRKLKQDFASGIVKEGKDLFEENKVVSAKLVHLDSKSVRISGRILGQYDNHYESEIEIDRVECETVDSNCDCPYNYDCQHLAALLFYLEAHLDNILVTYSKETDLKEVENDAKERKKLRETFKQAESKELQRQEELYQKQVLQEYIVSSEILALSPFFRSAEAVEIDTAECALIFAFSAVTGHIEIQLALRLPCRSKPLHVFALSQFLTSLRYAEPLFLGGKRYCFSLQSFKGAQQEMLRMVMDHARPVESSAPERSQRIALLDAEVFGTILSRVYEITQAEWNKSGFTYQDEELPLLPGLYEGGLETPIRVSKSPATLQVALEYLAPPVSKILLVPKVVASQETLFLHEAHFFECTKPGMLFRHTYYAFPPNITRKHLRSMHTMSDMTIPEPLFGTFVENALPELHRYVDVTNESAIEDFVTIPYVGNVDAVCNLAFLNSELEAILHFRYDNHEIPAAPTKLSYEHLSLFTGKEGILARNLVQEKKLLEELFQDFLFNPELGAYVAKSEKKIVEFMTDTIPKYQHRVTFHCPQNLLDQFIYDQTQFSLHFLPTAKVDAYEVSLEVNGALKGISVDLLWDCVASKRAFIELEPAKLRIKKTAEGSSGRFSKILVLDLDRIAGVVQLFDELGITILDNHTIERPLWSLASVDVAHFEGLPIALHISEKLIEIRKQMLGENLINFSPVPSTIAATLRPYQEEGTRWLEKLRTMYLGGILADDMGLGKTLQAIVAITQNLMKKPSPSLIVCPTSLLYNWKEECTKFNPQIRALVIDGVPNQRKKLLDGFEQYDVIITSYTLLQKDIENYREHAFSYVILDEAQHIKNRGTRNAKSVKMVEAQHRLILSGTPIENSLDELWSLFDFLMPGFLSSYDRFVEKYIRASGAEQTKNIDYLRKKIAPFILRRMKGDVLDDLPPVSEIVYHCQLSEVQAELYKSYAASARDELVKLVQKEGFDRVQIHVLATLTRLKQICCHPAIFAKEKPEIGDSAKYEMLTDLLQTLIEGGHKTVIFSQYTRMLHIMREDFSQKGIRFAYLDGSSKNRLDVVREFNEDPTSSVFLVSLKAGGTGLNLVGADTVIHYDMWWNPAAQSQATDRVHRLGQKRSVSSYTLITLGTIEEKIAEMQKRKKGLVKKVVSCDDEALAKLTWEDVLELLKT